VPVDAITKAIQMVITPKVVVFIDFLDLLIKA
jgi:hypothetical protein